MKVIVSDPISEDGLRIFKDNNIEVINANGQNIDDYLNHIKSVDGWIIFRLKSVEFFSLFLQERLMRFVIFIRVLGDNLLNSNS